MGAETPKWTGVSTELCNSELIVYCQNLPKTLSQIHQTAKAVPPRMAEEPLHPFKSGDWLLVKGVRRKHSKAKRWLGPFQFLLTTQTAVKVAERGKLIDVSHCKLFTGELPVTQKVQSDKTHGAE